MAAQTPANPPNQCPSCGGKHWTARELMACKTFGPPASYRPPVSTEMATSRQLWYIRDILKRNPVEVSYASGLTKVACSDYITDLKAGRAHLHQPAQSHAASAVQSAGQASQRPVLDNKPWTLDTPQAMVNSTRDGRFAVRADETQPYKFIRISRPKNGKKKGCLVLQTQHSDAYKDCVIVWPSGSVSVYDRRIDPFLLMVVVDPVGASHRYGQELGRCCCCGRELTDGRSIHYGIGPECETKWPEIIMSVDDENNGVPYERLR